MAFELIQEESDAEALTKVLELQKFEKPVPVATPPKAPPNPDVAMQRAAQQSATAQKLLLFALGQLSKRTVAGFSALFSLFGLLSVWFLYFSILQEPNNTQLIGIGMYSLFLLLLEALRRRKQDE
jgi:hypothetical protein